MDTRRVALKSGRGDKQYFDAYSQLTVHVEMLSDRRRTEAYRHAVGSGGCVRDKVVMDVGAGTGILSAFCCRAGAAHVYAVEASVGMASLLKEFVVANALSDRITVINAPIEQLTTLSDIDPQLKANVIVSEWMGYCLLYEWMLPSVLYARDHFLAQNGVLLPDRARIFMAPASLPVTWGPLATLSDNVTTWRNLSADYGVSFAPMQIGEVQRFYAQMHVDTVEPSCLVARPACVVELHLRTLDISELGCLAGRAIFSAYGRARVNAFCLWFDVSFPDGENSILSCSPELAATHWAQSVVCLAEPLEVEQDDVMEVQVAFGRPGGFERGLSIDMHLVSRSATDRAAVTERNARFDTTF